MEFADEKFKISSIINAEKDEEIIQKAPDSVSDESKRKRITFKRENKFGTSLTNHWEKDMWINGVSILMQICNNMDPVKFLAHQSKGTDDLIR